MVNFSLTDQKFPFKLVFNKNVLSDILAPCKAWWTSQLKQLDSLHLRPFEVSRLAKKKIACAFRRSPSLATCVINDERLLICVKVFIKSSFSSPEPSVPLSQRGLGTRILPPRPRRLRRTCVPGDETITNSDLKLHHFSSDPMKCFRIPAFDWTHLTTSPNRSYHRSIVSSLSLAWTCSRGKVTRRKRFIFKAITIKQCGSHEISSKLWERFPTHLTRSSYANGCEKLKNTR